MSQLGSDEHQNNDRSSQAHAFADAVVAESAKMVYRVALADLPRGAKRPHVSRRTPRVSLIVVLPENHVVSPDRLAESLRSHGNKEIDIVVACAGQPTNLTALQRSVGEAQFLLAPAGTSDSFDSHSSATQPEVTCRTPTPASSTCMVYAHPRSTTVEEGVSTKNCPGGAQMKACTVPCVIDSR